MLRTWLSTVRSEMNRRALNSASNLAAPSAATADSCAWARSGARNGMTLAPASAHGSPPLTCEELIQPAHAFGGRTGDPVPAQGGGEVDSARGVRASHASLKDCPDVVDLQLRPSEPVKKPVAAFGCGLPASRPVVPGASQEDGFLLAGLSQLEDGEFAHRLMQPVTGEAFHVLLHHQGLVDQR